MTQHSQNDRDASSNTANHQKSTTRTSFQRWFFYYVYALGIYFIFATITINAKYVDFGDGNYLYLSWRLSEGDVLYRDLPSPQPPLLLFLGSFLLSLSDGDPLLVRIWQVIQHMLTSLCVLGIAFRIYQKTAIAALAGIIYLFLPEGVWWAAGYQSEPLLVLLQSFNLFLLLTALRKDRPTISLYGSALLSVLCGFTNMTALPYILLQWGFLAYLNRRLFWHYSSALVFPGLLFLGFMYIYSHGEYIDHVFFRQVGTYPSDSFQQAFSYFIGKLNQEGGDILFYEGGFVFAAIAGIFLYAGNEQDDPKRKAYLVWWAIFSLGSIIFVTKGGTVEYIFTIGEPAVAIFSAYFLTNLLLAAEVPTRLSEIFKGPIQFGKFTLFICLFLPVLLMKPINLLYWTLTNATREVVVTTSQGKVTTNRSYVFEIPGKEMETFANYIKKMCPEDKLMLAPPYYAFIAKRELAENASSLFILYLAYFNEWEQFKKTHNITLDIPSMSDLENVNFEDSSKLPYSPVAIAKLANLFDENPNLAQDYPVIHLFLRIRRQIFNKEVALIIQNNNHLFFKVPPLHQAIQDYCKEAEVQPILVPREERLTVYVPK